MNELSELLEVLSDLKYNINDAFKMYTPESNDNIYIGNFNEEQLTYFDGKWKKEVIDKNKYCPIVKDFIKKINDSEEYPVKITYGEFFKNNSTIPEWCEVYIKSN